MIKALIFDLDSCLCAANEVGDQLFAPAFNAIRSANVGTVPDDVLKAAFADCWRFPFDWIATRYGFSEQMRSAGFDAFRQTEVRQPMHGYGDLDVLADLPAKLFLVTSGFRRLQESKVKALGFAGLFTEIVVDAIDEPGHQGKLKLFQQLMRAHGFLPEEMLVVGDNPDSEIDAGNKLGMKTIQILRPGVPPSDKATHRIRTLAELKQFIQSGPTLR